jgi:hypothetical protein
MSYYNFSPSLTEFGSEYQTEPFSLLTKFAQRGEPPQRAAAFEEEYSFSKRALTSRFPLSQSLPMNGCVTSVSNQYRVSRSCHLFGKSKWVIPPEQFAAKWWHRKYYK